jgi:hypothetical protein
MTAGQGESSNQDTVNSRPHCVHDRGRQLRRPYIANSRTSPGCILSCDASMDLKGNRTAVHPSGTASKTRETASSGGAAANQTCLLPLSGVTRTKLTCVLFIHPNMRPQRGIFQPENSTNAVVRCGQHRAAGMAVIGHLQIHNRPLRHGRRPGNV